MTRIITFLLILLSLPLASLVDTARAGELVFVGPNRLLDKQMVVGGDACGWVDGKRSTTCVEVTNRTGQAMEINISFQGGGPGVAGPVLVTNVEGTPYVVATPSGFASVLPPGEMGVIHLSQAPRQVHLTASKWVVMGTDGRELITLPGGGPAIFVGDRRVNSFSTLAGQGKAILGSAFLKVTSSQFR